MSNTIILQNNTSPLEVLVQLESCGTDGLSAYQQAVAAGYTGTEAEYTALLQAVPQLAQQAASAAQTAKAEADRAKAEADRAASGTPGTIVVSPNLGIKIIKERSKSGLCFD